MLAWFKRFGELWSEGFVIMFTLALGVGMTALVSALGGFVIGSIWSLFQPGNHLDDAGLLISFAAGPYWIGFVMRVWEKRNHTPVE